MAVLLGAIICPIVFGLCFSLQTAYFLYKVIQSRRDSESQCSLDSKIAISEGEASVCMGWAWTSCIDKTSNTMSIKAFIAWYCVALTVTIIVTIIFYLWLIHFNRIYV